MPSKEIESPGFARLVRRPGRCLAVGLAAGVLFAVAGSGLTRGEEPATADASLNAMLDDDAWGLTNLQWRILAASGVVLGLVGFAALTSFVVVRLSERRRVSDPPCVLDLMPLAHHDRRRR
jgi:hypothetical protein